MPVKIGIEGLNALYRKIAFEPVYRRPWRDALTRVTRMVFRRARGFTAPRGATGDLVTSLAWRIDAADIPRFGVVSADAQHGGVRYPFILEAGKRGSRAAGNVVHLHYRSGQRRGQSTKRWLVNARSEVWGQVADVLNSTARAIESGWR